MIEPRIFGFPLSLILAAAVLLCVFLFRDSRFAGFLSSRKVSVAAILVAAALIAVEGTIGPGLFHHWSFFAVIVYLLFSIAFSALVAGRTSHFALC